MAPGAHVPSLTLTVFQKITSIPSLDIHLPSALNDQDIETSHPQGKAPGASERWRVSHILNLLLKKKGRSVSRVRIVFLFFVSPIADNGQHPAPSTQQAPSTQHTAHSTQQAPSTQHPAGTQHTVHSRHPADVPSM